VSGREWVLTIDFEAFGLEAAEVWTQAMRHWARRSAEHSFRFSIFLAYENVVQLREADGAAFDEFVDALREMRRAGATYHLHNHYLFDLGTGRRPAIDEERDPRNPYPKRRSLFYDVVHRHGYPLGRWLLDLERAYSAFLEHAGLPEPRQRAFRAGGWDHGVGERDLRAYVDALREADIAIDSSASTGVFGTSSWRVGAPFGENAFWLAPGVLEIAPCLALDCGSTWRPRTIAATVRAIAAQRRLLTRDHPGALVTVLHFDHLFRSSHVSIERRVDGFFALLRILRSLLRLRSIGFEDLQLGTG
jgi:hypothetical protein